MSEESKNVVKKKCSVCHEPKPLSSFYAEKRSRDGRAGRCKACHIKNTNAWQASHREQLNLAARARNARNAERNLELKRPSQRRHPQTKLNYQRARRQAFPEKLKAYNAVQRAVRAGEIIRPTACENCHEEKRLQAHHHDYSRPLDVFWLCQQCHKLAHHFPNELTIAIPQMANA